MKILIIGGAGFLGANLVRFCLRPPGAEITVMDSLEPKLRADTTHLTAVMDSIRFVRASLLDEAALAELVVGQDLIFNCAAQSSHPLSLQEPLFDAEINCLGNLKLLETLRRRNRDAIVVYASSSTVIGRAVGEVVDEAHGEKPLDIYSANKSVAEKYYRIYHAVHDLKTVALRFANLYGPYGKGFPEFGMVNYFLHVARAGGTIQVFGDGGQTRNVLFVEDAVAALWTATKHPRLFGETWFVAHDEHFSVAAIAAAIVQAVGRGSVEHVPWPEVRRRIELDHVRISSARFRELTGWRPRHSLAEGLRQTLRIMEQCPP
jgi:nucleoside-diphosphate-sugar epimerase